MKIQGPIKSSNNSRGIRLSLPSVGSGSRTATLLRGGCPARTTSREKHKKKALKWSHQLESPAPRPRTRLRAPPRKRRARRARRTRTWKWRICLWTPLNRRIRSRRSWGIAPHRMVSNGRIALRLLCPSGGITIHPSIGLRLLTTTLPTRYHQRIIKRTRLPVPLGVSEPCVHWNPAALLLRSSSIRLRRKRKTSKIAEMKVVAAVKRRKVTTRAIVHFAQDISAIVIVPDAEGHGAAQPEPETKGEPSRYNQHHATKQQNLRRLCNSNPFRFVVLFSASSFLPEKEKDRHPVR